MPGDARGVGRRVGAVAGGLPRPPRFRPQRPRASPSSSGRWAAARKRGGGTWGGGWGGTRVPGPAPRGSAAGLGSPTGHPKPASPTRSGRELSPRLLPPPWHQERLSSPRLPAVPADPQPPSLPGCLQVPSFASDCEMVLRGRYPENLGLRVESNQHGSEVPGVWNF